MFTTRRASRGITGGKLTLGADAAVAAGPVGRTASAATDQNFAAEVYSYSRSRGLFAGVALDGTSISVDRKANGNFYKKKGVLATEIINGTRHDQQDDSARRFLGRRDDQHERDANGVDGREPHGVRCTVVNWRQLRRVVRPTPAGPAAGPHSTTNGARHLPDGRSDAGAKSRK